MRLWRPQTRVNSWIFYSGASLGDALAGPDSFSGLPALPSTAGQTRTSGLRRLGKGLSENRYPLFWPGCSLALCGGARMGNWLVSHFTIFGVQAQNWMLVALALIAVAIVFAWVSNSD
jgi:hypothetical protein